MKIKLKGAQTGHSLLKRKSDALSSRFRSILARIRKAKYEMNELLKGAALAMAQVNYAAGDISYAVREAAGSGPAQFQVQTRVENVSGVQLPIFEAHIISASSTDSSSSSQGQGQDFTALSRGGQQVQKCREANQRFVQSLLNLASLQTAFHILEEIIQITNRRVNALEYIILPRTENTINYITSELDEQDREEFFRLKKVQAKKKIREAAAEAEREKGEEEDIVYEDGIVSGINLLDLENDPDIIF